MRYVQIRKQVAERHLKLCQTVIKECNNTAIKPDSSGMKYAVDTREVIGLAFLGDFDAL